MGKSNDSSKLGRAPQVRELRDDELEKVSGGYKMSHVIDGTSNTIFVGERS